MAEMNLPQKGGKRKTAVPRIDLTPMVDLGFLLITFFMFTTTLAQSRKMEINMPSPEPVDHPTTFPEESTITLLPAAGHKIAYYEGTLKEPSQMHVCSIKQIRAILDRKKTVAATLPAKFSVDAHKLHVIIKPSHDSKYSDLVALLDEMLIQDIRLYAIVDITSYEVNMLPH